MSATASRSAALSRESRWAATAAVTAATRPATIATMTPTRRSFLDTNIARSLPTMAATEAMAPVSTTEASRPPSERRCNGIVASQAISPPPAAQTAAVAMIESVWLMRPPGPAERSRRRAARRLEPVADSPDRLDQ